VNFNALGKEADEADEADEESSLVRLTPTALAEYFIVSVELRFRTLIVLVTTRLNAMVACILSGSTANMDKVVPLAVFDISDWKPFLSIDFKANQ